ncbi:hypothetical protein [Nocardiopsis sp. CA-288880]|uniref:hypothetical protein n=1 Tax=Nocardiopsis sp. CA-288880 TaxID=3239995 RepID=UPI003D96CF68
MAPVTGATGNIGRVLPREPAERGPDRPRDLARDAANAGLPGGAEADGPLRIHGTVEPATGSPAAPFERCAPANAAAFR